MTALVAVVLSSCGENSSAYKTLKAQYDSLTLINQSYEHDLNETDSLVASVLTNFQDIASVESMININAKSGDVRRGERERIQDNVMLITDKLKASSEALDALTKKLEAGSVENKRLRHTIVALRRELELQTSRVQSLREELMRKDISIMALDSMVTNLSGDIDRLNETTARQSENLAKQEQELNAVRYCIGTSRDLKDYKILVRGSVNTDGVDGSYFTSADLRSLTQIPLFSKKAKLLTIHPSKSYELVADGEKQLTLNITNPQAFWSSSRTLIVQVD